MPRFVPGRRGLLCALFVAALFGASGVSTLTTLAAAPDAILDAKRKAAAQLVKDGKTAEAVSLIREVLATDESGYADHLLLARAHEKLNQPDEAMRQYKRVLELVPASSTRTDEKTARVEADKKLKLMDPVGGKVEALTDEVLRKIDALEKEAIALHSMSGLERVFRFRGQIWAAEHRDDRGYVELAVNREWQETGMTAVAGQRYRVRAAGTWVVNGASCSAAGTTERPGSAAPYGRAGQVVAQVAGNIILLGEDARFTAPAAGPLLLMSCGDSSQPTRAKSNGVLQVLISRE